MSFLINPFIYAVGPVGCSGSLISTTSNLAYYNFQGSMTDYSGQGNYATPTNLSYTSSGWYQSGGTFNGSSTNVNMPSKDYSIASSYTITAWIKTNTSVVTPMQIVSKDKVNAGAANRRDFQFRMDGTADGVGKLRFVRFSNNTTVVSNFASTGTVNSGNWVHVAAVFNNGVGSKIYINGVEDGSDAVTTNNQNSTDSNIRIGSLEDNASLGIANVFSGNTDEVSFWNRPLSASEILTLASSTCPLNASCPSNLISSTSLAAYYKFNNDVTDSSGNANNATSTGVTYNTGQFDNSAVFNGSTSQVSAPDSATLDITGNLTINTWVYLNAQPATNQYMYLVSKSATKAYTMTYRDVAGVKRFENYIFADATTTNFSYQLADHTLTLSAWTMVTFVATPGNAINSKFKMYVNGTLLSDTETNFGSGCSAIFNNTEPLFIGHDGANSQRFNGRMDDVSVWSRNLTDAEILNLYNSTCPLKS